MGEESREKSSRTESFNLDSFPPDGISGGLYDVGLESNGFKVWNDDAARTEVSAILD